MAAFTEPLPGLLDDPIFQLDLPELPEYHIAPLRNPGPRNVNIPLPLEPVANAITSTRPRPSKVQDIGSGQRKYNAGVDHGHAHVHHEQRKPNLTINELLEIREEEYSQSQQLPSFISLAIVENSPSQHTVQIDLERPVKRRRTDLEGDAEPGDEYRHLPLPPQKDDKKRPAPLLPAMVTGLHEPPPTAALLPSMELQTSLQPDSRSKTSPKIANARSKKKTTGRPPELMLNSPEMEPMAIRTITARRESTSQDQAPADLPTTTPGLFKAKQRRAAKKWTEQETRQLMEGVEKYGIGRWKLILTDDAFDFTGRTTVDLKDRFRVCQPETYNTRKIKASKDEVKSGPTILKTPSQDSNEEDHKGRRRKRRPWTAAEDDALLKGVNTHGFQWTAIHTDPDLNLSHRKATDLRDRIRNMFPDGYKNAEPRTRSEWPQVVQAGQEVLSVAAVAGITESDARRSISATARAKRSLLDTGDGAQEQQGLTLPPLVLDDEDWDWSNNTLPPLLDWEEMGI